MKTCFKCGDTKPLSSFYKHPRMADGHLGKCKECTKRDVHLHRLENIDKIREYDRKRSDKPHRVAGRKEISAAWQKDPVKRELRNRRSRERGETNKIKKAIYTLCRRAINNGKLEKKPCEWCGETEKIQAHHEDYNYPMDVTWLCPKCHGQRHREINAERRDNQEGHG